MDIRIGITTSFDGEEQRLHRAYVQAVEQAGGVPLLVPMVEHQATVHALVELLDGLVVCGGPAVVDGLIGALPADLEETHAVRARADKQLVSAFLETGKPILGICYGMQLLNALDGGTIYGDLQAHVPDALVHSPKRGGNEHTVQIRSGTCLHALLQAREVTVNTRHIQALAEVGSRYRVAATAPDGVVEGIEAEDGRLMGVQFHPERMGPPMLPLFRHLVAEARKTPHAMAASLT
jgi:putative glutamine amidotransferase